jgi:hypothetical protein
MKDRCTNCGKTNLEFRYHEGGVDAMRCRDCGAYTYVEKGDGDKKMGIKKQLPAKYRTRQMTKDQQEAIEKIQKKMAEERKEPVAFLEAKHQFFTELDIKEGKTEEKKEPKAKKEPKEKKERKTLTIGEAKIGVTMVFSKGDCKKLGFDAKDSTKDVIKKVRDKLGLPEKAIKE